ncbi:pre-60S factor REI1 [Pseudoscourfieldia marina]
MAAAQRDDAHATTSNACATCLLAFAHPDLLKAHYRTDLHRYNLKRKVASLPPVTLQWFDARRAQLARAQQVAQAQVFVCPLTKKRFQSEATYRAHTQTKKYKALLAQRLARTNGTFDATPQVFDAKSKNEREASAGRAADDDDMEEQKEEDDMEEEEDEEEEDERWDPCTCLFSNEQFESVEACLVSMHKRYGFFLPYVDRLVDVEGLLRYLGAKLVEGGIPLYMSGLDPDAKRFPNLHAVQRHMVDTNKCRMLFEGNEDEYDIFYELDMESGDEDDDIDDNEEWEEMSDDEVAAMEMAGASSSRSLALVPSGATSRPGQTGGSTYTTESGELVVSVSRSSVDEGGVTTTRSFGHRAYARYYKQRYKPVDTRSSVSLAVVSQRYQEMGIATVGLSRRLKGTPAHAAEGVASIQARHKQMRNQMRTDWRSDKINKLPKNVPH